MLTCPRCHSALPLAHETCGCGAAPTLDGVGLVCGACLAWSPPLRATCAACGGALGAEGAAALRPPGAAVPALAPQRARRVVVAASGATAELAAGSAVVCGRGDVDLRVAGATVSRRHARFTADDAGVRVEDLGSLNGTWIRLPAGRGLAPGDEVFSRGRRLRRRPGGGFEQVDAAGARTAELADDALDRARSWLRIRAPERVVAGDEVLLGAERLRVEP